MILCCFLQSCIQIVQILKILEIARKEYEDIPANPCTVTWEAPRNLHEIFDITSEEVLRYIPDYKINLIAPAEMTDEEINQFQTDCREVMLFVKYSKDKKYLKKLVSEDTHFSSMNVKTARVISAVTGIEIEAEDYICLYTKR